MDYHSPYHFNENQRQHIQKRLKGKRAKLEKTITRKV